MIDRATQNRTIRLTATHELGSTEHHDLKQDQSVFVGSSSNCGFRLVGNDLSEIHCHIGIEDGKLMVQDWMSSQGTRVNGELISAQVEIQPDDIVQIGKYEISFSSIGSNSYATAPIAKVTAEPPPPVVATPAVETSVVETSVVETSVDRQIQQQSPAALPAESSSNSDTTMDVPDDETPNSFDFDDDFFKIDEEETYDRETVALLHAEIEELQAALAQRDAERSCERCDQRMEDDIHDPLVDGSDEVLQRMQDLIDEANRSDEHVSILEESLHAAEDANRTGQEERRQLEAWVADIEKRIGQREDEHAAEVDALRQRLEESTEQQQRLQRQLRQAATGGNAPKHYEETLEQLQATNKSLQDSLAETQKERTSLEQRIETLSDVQEISLREERASIAKEQAKLSRMRFEITSKLAEVEDLPKVENPADRETSNRIQALRQHLREIHEQEKSEEKEVSLTSRLAKLWHRVEY
ncbi:Chromosome partition protein Smc [Rubripirellula lacrimiformis]|uniref:Chromosome partition protein Smc n=1 Tax=Rubripirellula lacrimiformis TaxID=1930273 RepID=A0A517NJG8_9BACT|nr:FHA domain-containing protein [Rubripirellula lacrimiformis]QDT07173.1 Chromosome partition protein Smc [Rubripirellula lacrimiformis]